MSQIRAAGCLRAGIGEQNLEKSATIVGAPRPLIARYLGSEDVTMIDAGQSIRVVVISQPEPEEPPKEYRLIPVKLIKEEAKPPKEDRLIPVKLIKEEAEPPKEDRLIPVKLIKEEAEPPKEDRLIPVKLIKEEAEPPKEDRLIPVKLIKEEAKPARYDKTDTSEAETDRPPVPAYIPIAPPTPTRKRKKTDR
jgi:hypothetical protein